VSVVPHYAEIVSVTRLNGCKDSKIAFSQNYSYNILESFPTTSTDLKVLLSSHQSVRSSIHLDQCRKHHVPPGTRSRHMSDLGSKNLNGSNIVRIAYSVHSRDDISPEQGLSQSMFAPCITHCHLNFRRSLD